MKRKSERGSAMLESLPLMILILLFATGILMAAYLFFTRAWIQYQSEQALYCASEGKPGSLCRAQLEAKIKTVLPWGDTRTSMQTWTDRWSVEIEWKYRKYRFHLAKQLSPKQILKTKALRW